MPRPLILLIAFSLFSANLYAEDPDPTKLPVVKKTLDKAEADIRRNRKAYDEANEKAFVEAEKALKAEVDRLSKQGKPEEAVAVKKLIASLKDRLAGGGGGSGDAERPTVPRRPVPVAPDPNAVVFNGHKYKLVMENLSWDEAKKRCEDMGGHLLVIEGRDENIFIMNALQRFKEQNKQIGDSDHIWLGVLRNDPKGQWVTLAGTPQIFSAWRTATGWPREGHTRGKINIFHLQWTSSTGSGEKAPHYFICEWDHL